MTSCSKPSTVENPSFNASPLYREWDLWIKGCLSGRGLTYNKNHMASFMGGSAPAMASQVAEGYILINPNTLKGYSPGDLANLKQELEKLQRDARAIVPSQDDALANQARNRRINRISTAVQMVTNKMFTRG